MKKDLRSLNEDHVQGSSSLKGFRSFLAYVKKAFKDRKTKEELGKMIVDSMNNSDPSSPLKEEELQDVFNELFDEINEEDNLSPQTIVPKKQNYLWYKIAAAVVLVTTVSALLYLSLRIENQKIPIATTYITRPGQKSNITLEDGSVVRLNSASKLIYPQVFQDSIREVTLEGEAFFEVVSNKDKPFIIRSNGVTTRVLGTSFNVRSLPDEPVAVTVASGRVRVSLDTPSPEEGTSEVILIKNQQAVAATGGLQRKNVDLEKYLAWTQNKLVFDEVKMDEVVKTLERWYGVEITLENKQMGNCLLAAEFHENSLQEVLDLIKFGQSGFEYKFIKEDEQVRVTINGSGCE